MIMLSLFTIKISKDFIYISEGNVPDQLESKMAQDVKYVIGYSSYPVLKGELVHVSRVSEQSIPTISLSGSDSEKLTQVISELKKFDYVEEQSDPSKVTKLKQGNCQSFSLILEKSLNESGVQAGVVTQRDHMYNWVMVGEKKYFVDVVDNYVKEADIR